MSIRNHAAGHALGSRDMAYLMAVADEGSLRRAALALGVSPAAVSKAVRQIEARLGAPVFDRATGGTRPTVAGEALIRSGREALAALSFAETDFRNASGLMQGQVRIGCGPFPAPGVARIVVPEAKRRWPALRLSIELGPATDLVPQLAQGSLDIALCHIEDIELPPGLMHRHLQTLSSVILVRPGHPLTGQGRVPLTALAGYGLAGFKPYSRFLHWYRRHVGQDADFAFTGPDFDILAETVARSDLLLFSSHYMAETLMRTHGLVELPVEGEAFSHQVHCIRASRVKSPAIEAVETLMHDLLHQSEIGASTAG
jgi:DNA-binding transcriptional LysR family regulator